MNEPQSVNQNPESATRMGDSDSEGASINRRVRLTHSKAVIMLFVLASVAMIVSDVFYSQMTDLILVIFAFYILIGLAWVVFTTNLRVIMVGVTATCICFSIWTSHWPLRARFNLSRSSFEELETRFAAGESIGFPRMAGLFRVSKIEQRTIGRDLETQATCFWLGEDKGNDFSGIVYSDKEEQGFNIWSFVPLEGPWHFVVED